jgi:hypothetical protein
MRTGQMALTRTLFVVLVTLGVALASNAVPAWAQPEVYRVRAGSQVLACGGFAGRCEMQTLHGTIELEIVTEDPAPSELAILETELYLATAHGSPFPFPDASDLQLAGLEGPFVGGEAQLEAENELGQSVHLTISRVERDFADPTPVSFVMQGTYDQGCCDRFVYELGNVMLDLVPEGGIFLDGDDVDRFTVRVHWKESPSGPTRDATPERSGPNAAQFWFFGPANPEIFVKLVPACEEQLGNQVWVFVAGLTDLDVTVVVKDQSTERENVYQSTPGQPFVTVTDTDAFPCLGRLE